MLKIAVFAIYPSPYRDMILYRMAKDKNVNIEIIFLEKTPTDHTEWCRNNIAFNNVYYCNRGLKYNKYEAIHFDAIIKFLKGKYDIVIIPGYRPITCLFILLLSLLLKKKYIFSSDSAKLPIDGTLNLSVLKRKILRLIGLKSSGIWLTGIAACSFWKDVCGDNIEEKIVEGLYILDSESIVETCTNRKKIRDKLEIDDNDYVYLFVGELIPKRKIRNLLDAFLCLAKDIDNIKLIVVGYGEQECIIREYQSKLKEKLIHIYRMKFDELNDVYKVANCYVHPGSEPYSLALVQAAFNNLWMISTDGVGAAYDYIEDRKNGVIIKQNDLEQLINEMKNALRKNIVIDNYAIFQKRSTLEITNNIIQFIRNVE